MTSTRGRRKKYAQPHLYSIRGEAWISNLLESIGKTEAEALEAGTFALLGMTESSKKATADIIKTLIHRKMWQREKLQDEINSLTAALQHLSKDNHQWIDSEALVQELATVVHPEDELTTAFYRAWVGRMHHGGKARGVVQEFGVHLMESANGNGEHMKAVLEKAADPEGIIERYLIERGIELSGITLRKVEEEP